MLPQSTVALRVSRSYSKVAYLKWSKSRISVHHFFSNQPSTLMREVTQLEVMQLKQQSTMRKFHKYIVILYLV